MSLPPATAAKVLARFDAVIAAGEALISNGKKMPATYDQWGHESKAAYTAIDREKFFEWRTNAINLVHHALPPTNLHFDEAKKWVEFTFADYIVAGITAMLRGIRSDLAGGYLTSLAVHVEAEIAGDYLGQAERLLGEGGSGQYDHVPAAVLGGAVLEKFLRALCERQQPLIPLVSPEGKPKTMNPLIDDLKKAGVFSELVAKQLRAWTDIRNAAAHGNFTEFNREQVRAMLDGITRFLAERSTP